MKKTIKLTLAVVFVMGATSLFAQKFGRINTQEVISVMPEMKEMQTNIEAYSKDLQESMENIVVEYNNKYQEFNKNFSTMSDAVRQLKEKELNDLIQRRNDFEQVAQQDLQKRYNELLAPIIDKAKAILMKSRGLDEAGAYALLRKTAMNQNRKIVDIAQSLVTAAGLLGPDT